MTGPAEADVLGQYTSDFLWGKASGAAFRRDDWQARQPTEHKVVVLFARSFICGLSSYYPRVDESRTTQQHSHLLLRTRFSFRLLLVYYYYYYDYGASA
ncbi:hypothetical protein N7539_008030 [Penicillium diatomitis]|uniref:Uncharacterized protein n=1 Tax=Penicillium diatomitis TaxID=2819901 RepID=A0A9W9WT04_9EURO|nr:uncharacterized protein N7539_008030 [Penicillium diatomitis]KAJ5474964.1 hypothetical protein N7539_008030 [Penicillium diatomitis]